MTPHYDANPNTGNEIATDVKLNKAINTVFHDKEHPSKIILPIIPR